MVVKNTVETNYNLPAFNQIGGALSSTGGNYTDFQIQPGTIAGNVNHVRFEFGVVNNGAAAVDLCPFPAYWINRIEFIDQTNGNKQIDFFNGDDVVHIMGLETTAEQQDALLARNGSGVTAGDYDLVTIAAGASAKFSQHLYGDMFRQIKPLMTALSGVLVVRVYWHPWAKFAASASPINLDLQSADMMMNCIILNPRLLDSKKRRYRTTDFINTFMTQFKNNISVAAFTPSTKVTFNLQGIVGPVGWLFITLEKNTPASLTERMSYVNLDGWTISIENSSGVQVGAPMLGKAYRFDEIVEKVKTPKYFCLENHYVYPYWFSSDPVQTLEDSSSNGMMYFDGNFKISLTPDSSTYNAGYNLSVIAYYDRTFMIQKQGLINVTD
jgi:hypothetical protein